MKDEVKWTDKVQAIAAIVGVIGILSTLNRLTDDDKNQQRQINGLENLACESHELNINYGKQLKYMYDQTTIMRDQSIMQKQAINLSLKPKLGISETRRNQALNGIVVYEFVVKNTGGDAHDLSISCYSNDDESYKSEFSSNYLSTSDIIRVKITCKDLNRKYKYLLQYYDFNRHLYNQEFYWKNDALVIDKPTIESF